MWGTNRRGLENTPFSADEQRRIETQLTEAKKFVRATYQLTPGQYEAIDARLDYLVDAAKRGVGRIDWRNALVGSLLSLVITSLVPVEPIQQLLPMVLRGIAALFGGDAAPRELPPGLRSR